MKNRIKTYKTSLKTSNIVSIDVNDVFEEITDQNKELREQIKLLVEFKQFFDKIIDKLKSYLNDYELSELKTFDHKLNRVFGSDIPLNEWIDIKVETDCLKGRKINGIECNDNESYDTNDEDFSPTVNKKSQMKTRRKRSNRNLTDRIVNKSKRVLNESKTPEESKPRKCKRIGIYVKPKKPRKPYERKKPLKEFYMICDQNNCNRVFRQRGKYYEHRLEAHKLIEEGFSRTVRTCDWPGCDFVTVRKDTYQNHINAHQGNHNPELIPIQSLLILHDQVSVLGG